MRYVMNGDLLLSGVRSKEERVGGPPASPNSAKSVTRLIQRSRGALKIGPSSEPEVNTETTVRRIVTTTAVSLNCVPVSRLELGVFSHMKEKRSPPGYTSVNHL